MLTIKISCLFAINKQTPQQNGRLSIATSFGTKSKFSDTLFVTNMKHKLCGLQSAEFHQQHKTINVKITDKKSKLLKRHKKR
jgi:hypothetical protein